MPSPSKKRRRAAPQNEDAPARTIAATSFQRFNTLPAELCHIIVQLACLASSSSSEPSSSTSSHSLYDMTTARSLSLVSREMSDKVSPIVWHSITIDRPSSLYALHQTLLARPHRAALVKSLHIGPQRVLPPQWFPLSQASVYDKDHKPGSPLKWMSTSLVKGQLPFGMEDFQSIPLDCPPSGCREAAIRDALNVAQRSLDASLFDKATRRPAITNVVPIFEVQAALDLYLVKVKAMEDENPELFRLGQPGIRASLRCRSGHCDHYPALVLTDMPASSRSDRPSRSIPQVVPPGNVLVVSYSQLMRHVARPGSANDNFDHPLIFNRSGISTMIHFPQESERTSEGFGGAKHHIVLRTQDIDESREDEFWPQLARLREENQAATFSGGEPLNAALVNTATLAANFRLVRNVLALTTNVSSLSLTGSLQWALGGQQVPSMRLLRRVSLGPAPCRSEASLSLKGLDFVEELRICNVEFSEGEIEAINELPRLRLLRWSLAEQVWGKYGQVPVPQMIHRLIEADLPSTPPAEPRAARRSSFDRDLSRRSPSPPLVIAQLHPYSFKEVLATALYPEDEEAWLHGRQATPGASRRLLLLKASGIAVTGGFEQSSKDSTSRCWDEMYEEGRQWRRGIGELSEGGRLRGGQ